MIVTIVVVAYLVVPNVTRFLHAAGGYDPAGYEPKDTARTSWLDAKGRMVGLPQFSIDQVVNVGLFVLVIVLWLNLTDRRRR